MSLIVLFLALVALFIYWAMTQILPERRRDSLLRPALADGLLDTLNDKRHAMGLSLLEMDDDLMVVAENKATHQFLTGVETEGWDYPSSFNGLFGRSLLIEVLLTGPAAVMGERLARQRDIFDGEWVTCGIGVAGGQSGQVVVAIVLCREAWEMAGAVTPERSLLERLALR